MECAKDDLAFHLDCMLDGKLDFLWDFQKESEKDDKLVESSVSPMVYRWDYMTVGLQADW